jgi:hypothetical protein
VGRDQIVLLEESWRELERERQRDERIKELRSARRAARPSRLATFVKGLRDGLRPEAPPPLAESC